MSRLAGAIDWQAIRSSGPGGQNVNKLATAVHLRFRIRDSQLDEKLKTALLAMKDRRLTDDGVLVIKASRFRSQEKNRADAIERLQEILASTREELERKGRRPTKPTRASQRKRVESKIKRGQVKAMRGRRIED